MSWQENQHRELEVSLNLADIRYFRNNWREYLKSNRGVLPEINKDTSAADICSGSLTILAFFPRAKERYAVDTLNDAYIAKYGRVRGVNYLSQKAEDISLNDNYFDVVFCINALDHTEDWRRVLGNIQRITKKGGKIYLEFEQTTYLERLFTRFGWKPHLSEYHLHLLSLNDVMKQMKGSKIERVEYSPPVNLKRLKSLFRKERSKWETKLTALNMSLGRKFIYGFIQLFNSIGYLISRKNHAGFIRVLIRKI